MQEIRSGTDAQRRLARWSVLLAVVALVAAGVHQCPGIRSPRVGSSRHGGSGDRSPRQRGTRVGGARRLQDRLHLARRLGAVREARLRRHQGGATAAGQELLFCDSEIDAAKALACAQNLKVQGAQGVLNFQVFQDSSPEICTAYGGVPTIAIDIVQPPCQIAFMGANNREAGRMAGAKIGEYAKTTWDCDYTAYVSLESTAAGAANTDRMGGYRDGFQEFCPITADKERVLDGADRTDPALEQMTNLLGALPGDKIVVVAINEDGILGAIGAANTLGRQTDLYYSGQGTDPSIWKDVACNPNYIASTAYFPSATAPCSSRTWSRRSWGGRSRRTSSPSTRSSTRTTSARSIRTPRPADAAGLGEVAA